MAKIDTLLKMSYEDFTNESALRKAVKQLADSANKRIKRLQESKLESRALDKAFKSGGKFTTKGKDFTELQDEFMRVKEFLESPSSTVKGIREARRKVIKSLKKSGVDISEEDFAEIMGMYEQLREENPSISEKDLYYRVLKAIKQYVADKDLDPAEIYEKIKEDLSKIYESVKEREYDYATSSFFRLEGEQ